MFIKYFENFLTKDECNSIIDMGESIELMEMKSSYIVNGKLVGENVKWDGNKRVGGYFINELLETQLIKEVSKKIINLSNELNPFNGVTYTSIPKYSFNRYGVGDFLDWHSDSHEILNGATITYVIQLNDEYDGGNVKYIINDVEYSVNKKQGSIFVFDSNITHSVDTVLSGVRYSINVWPSKIVKKSLI
jgi:hypothetical protein